MTEYEFTVVRDFYIETEDEEGNPYIKLVKKNMATKWYCRDLNMISSFEQAFNEEGNIRMHHTKLMVAGDEKIVKLPYSKVKTLLGEVVPKVIGFQPKK